MARRHYFVRRGMQGRFIAAFLALALVGAAATAVAAGLAVARTLDAALFRAHFTERSTSDLLLPVLLKVNVAAAAAIIAGGLLIALIFFARQAQALDRLCARLGGWQLEVRSPIADRPSKTDHAASCPAQGWAADLEVAFRDAEQALRATYESALKEAVALTADAEKLSHVATVDGADASLARAAQTLRERLDRIEAALAGIQTIGN